MSKETYTIRFDVNVHGWEERVEVEVEADNQRAACNRLGEVLTELCSKRRGTQPSGHG